MTVTCNYFSIKTQGNTSEPAAKGAGQQQCGQQNGENSDDNMAYECPKKIIKRIRDCSQIKVVGT